jgi:uncharacterized protein (TIGR01777 family)
MVMRVLITGGSGLIGRHLVQRVLKAGGRPVVVSRHSDLLRRNRESRDYEVVQGDVGVPGRWQEAVDGCDAVVNLAGHNLFAERWNAKVKRKIRDSRVYGSEHVAAAIESARSRPQVLVQGSAIGFYGPHGDEEIDEASPSGSDFLASVCREWEEASASVEAFGGRRAMLRTGVVLAPGEGALKVMTPIFKFGPGAPVGGGGGMGPATGQQWMSWIHIDDIAGIFQLALDNPEAAGPINGTAPNPVRNADFARALSKTLRTPYTPWRFFVPIGPPDPLLHLMLGEVADVVAKGQKVFPKKAVALGYKFQHPDLTEALKDVFTPRPAPQPVHPASVASHSRSHH